MLQCMNARNGTCMSRSTQALIQLFVACSTASGVALCTASDEKVVESLGMRLPAAWLGNFH